MRSASHRRFFVPRCPGHPARGQASVEFALVIVLLMIMVLSMLELILLMHTYNTLADSAKEGVRYAEVHGSRNSIPSPSSCTSASCTCGCSDITGSAAPP